MEENEKENSVITEEDFKKFLSAETYEEQLKILLAHAEKNRNAANKRQIYEITKGDRDG